mgnify:CR=1 FL=1|tara:strand:+ start:2162 stop:2827 length:666 start_codon:yes stop_codon:yes gene_type:complete
MKLMTIKSMHPTNEFAPSWNIPIHLSTWNDYEKIDNIKNFLINKEPKLLNDPPELLVSAQHERDSLFKYIKQLPELDDLLNFLRISYIYCIHSTHSEFRDCYITSWYNVVHKGQRISKHLHDAGPNGHLSANMHLDNYTTTTDYHVPFDQENINSFPNQKGGLVIFPSYLPHSVTEHTEDTLRVSIAFDITLEKSNVHESIKFMDDEILNRLTNPTNEAII